MKLSLTIEGMTCGSCSKAITARLSKFSFISNISINHDSGKGEMEISNTEDKKVIIEAIEKLGFTAMETVLN